jgi:hypothetical protein
MRTLNVLLPLVAVSGCRGCEPDSAGNAIAEYRAHMKALADSRDDAVFLSGLYERLGMEVPISFGGALPLGKWMLMDDEDGGRRHFAGPAGERLAVPELPFVRFVSDAGVFESEASTTGGTTCVVVGTREHVLIISVSDGAFTRVLRKPGTGWSLAEWRDRVRAVDRQASTERFVDALRCELGVSIPIGRGGELALDGWRLVREHRGLYLSRGPEERVGLLSPPFVVFLGRAGIVPAPRSREDASVAVIRTQGHVLGVEIESGVVSRLCLGE